MDNENPRLLGVLASALNDPQFRERLWTAPRATLLDAGLSEEEIEVATGLLALENQPSEAQPLESRVSPWVVNTLGGGSTGGGPL
jgi:hypothetical protein